MGLDSSPLEMSSPSSRSIGFTSEFDICNNIYVSRYKLKSEVLFSTSIFGQIGGPKSKVVSQQLHDESAVFVWLLTQRIQLGDRLIKSLFSQMASPERFQQQRLFRPRISIENRIRNPYKDNATMGFFSTFQESSRSHSRRQKSWEPGQGGSGELMGVLCSQCLKRPKIRWW